MSLILWHNLFLIIGKEWENVTHFQGGWISIDFQLALKQNASASFLRLRVCVCVCVCVCIGVS